MRFIIFAPIMKFPANQISVFDPVTIADQCIEKCLREKISAKYPDHGIMGEEQATMKGNAFTWIIDPIDGTRAFISGSPMWGILIGLMENNKPLLGLMHQPLLKETFFADSSKACGYETYRFSRSIHAD